MAKAPAFRDRAHRLAEDRLRRHQRATDFWWAKFPTCRSSDDGAPNNLMVAAYSAIHAETSISPTPTPPTAFDFSGTRKFDEVTGYRSQSFLTVPMKNHENEVIGVLQLINAMAPGMARCGHFPTAIAGWPNRWLRRRRWRSPTAC